MLERHVSKGLKRVARSQLSVRAVGLYFFKQAPLFFQLASKVLTSKKSPRISTLAAANP
jgi:hypothetical protein